MSTQPHLSPDVDHGHSPVVTALLWGSVPAGKPPPTTRHACGWSVAALMLCGACNPPPPPPQSKPLPVALTRVQAQPSYHSRESFTGKVRSRRESQLGFERSGLVQRITVDEGDHIRQGQVIAVLDRRQLQHEHQRLQAQLREADASVQLTNTTQKRTQTLADKQYLSTQQGDDARFAYEAAVARRDQLRAALASIALDLKKSMLVAPFAGTVAARLIDEGAVVSGGSPVIRLLESAALEVVVGVPVALAELCHSAATPVQTRETPTQWTLRVGARQWQPTCVGRVRDVVAATRTIDLILTLPETAALTSGQLATLEIQRQHPVAGYWLPLSALRQGVRGLWSAYAAEKVQGKAKVYRVSRAAVEVLHTEAERAFVRGTLRDGDQVITAGAHRVVPGQQVVRAPRPSKRSLVQSGKSNLVQDGGAR